MEADGEHGEKEGRVYVRKMTREESEDGRIVWRRKRGEKRRE